MYLHDLKLLYSSKAHAAAHISLFLGEKAFSTKKRGERIVGGVGIESRNGVRDFSGSNTGNPPPSGWRFPSLRLWCGILDRLVADGIGIHTRDSLCYLRLSWIAYRPFFFFIIIITDISFSSVSFLC